MNDSPPGWFARNWKWFVPVGCLTLLLVVAAAGAVIGFGVLRIFESSGMGMPKRDALAAAQASPAMKQALGEPMQLGFLMSGGIQITNDHGHADVSFPIHGPRGKGRVYVVGEMVRGRWSYSEMEARIDGRPAPIDLRPTLAAPAAAAPPAH